MKDLFFSICVGCFSICSFNFLYGFWCGVWGKEPNQYVMGFWGCLTWWIVYDAVKEIGWLR